MAKSRIQSLAVKGEHFYRMRRDDWRGHIYFPGVYETAPISVPPPRNFGGFCKIEFFDKYGRETRTIVDKPQPDDKRSDSSESGESAKGSEGSESSESGEERESSEDSENGKDSEDSEDLSLIHI